MNNILHTFIREQDKYQNIYPPHCLLVGCDKNREQRKQRGFTIIEVALVLAIAGLIFLVVFLALPALQNSQKDTARRQDVGRVVAAIEQFESDNNGGITGTYASTFDGKIWTHSWSDGHLGNYISNLGSSFDYTWLEMSVNVGLKPSGMKDLVIYTGVVCKDSSSDGNYLQVASSTNVAVMAKLTSGNYYCVDAN